MIIAIDGPAAAGKGTLAKNLAKNLNFAYLDTGALYRAVGLKTMLEKKDPANDAETTLIAQNMTATDFTEVMKHPDLRKEKGATAAAKVAKNQAVRDALLAFQQNFAKNPILSDGSSAKGAVLDGRDIGTVVCKNADFKFFVTASPEARAKRRFMEYQEKNLDTSYESVLEDVKKRDESDKNRTSSPLIPADDAIILDTTSMSIDKVYNIAFDYIKPKL